MRSKAKAKKWGNEVTPRRRNDCAGLDRRHRSWSKAKRFCGKRGCPAHPGSTKEIDSKGVARGDFAKPVRLGCRHLSDLYKRSDCGMFIAGRSPWS